MTEPLPVTDEDVRAAWDQFYARPNDLDHIPVVPPEPGSSWDQLTLDGLRQVLENDRKRVIERTPENS